MLYIDNALSVRALQEMMSAENEMVCELINSNNRLIVFRKAQVEVEVTKPYFMDMQFN